MKAWLVVALLVLSSCTSVSTTGTAIASLDGAEGSVMVNGKAATTGAMLKEGDTVQTGVASRAQVVFYDSAVLRLDENTEITIQDTADKEVAVFQSSGQTWSRVLKLSGVSQYDVETPTTIASVRGTGFKVVVGKEGTEVAVGEGAVEVSTKKDGRILKRQMVHKLQRAMVRHDMLDRMEMSAMTDDAFMDSNLDEDEAFIDLMIKRFAKKYPRVVKALQEAGYDREDAEDWMRDLATGEMTPDEMRVTIKDAMQDLEREGIVRNLETDTDEMEPEQDSIEQEIADLETRDLCADQADADRCYNERAAETNDASHCGAVQDQQTRDSCLSTVAVNTENAVLCNEIVDNEVRVFCESNTQAENRITGSAIIVLPQ